MSLVFQVELCPLEKHFLYVKLLTLILKSLLGIISVYACMVQDNFFSLLLQEQKKPLQCPDLKPVNCLCSHATNLAFYYARNYSLE